MTEILKELLMPQNVSCMVCKSEKGMGGADGLCAACRQACRAYTGPEYVEGVHLLAPYAYQGVPAKLIRGLKYDGRRYMARPLALAMERVLSRAKLSPDAIVPIPVHPNRLRERGFNHAEVIAAALAVYTGLPVQTDLVRRVIDTPHQVGMSKELRQKNMKHAFEADQRASGLHLLLLDDVCTTGATLSACARVLREKGARINCICAAAAEE
ncbi:MAG: ComF family protein [Clostridia bacterium]|nr:ComF family protein [Clostridia bacterium]